jgi:hypothetical protein
MKIYLKPFVTICKALAILTVNVIPQSNKIDAKKVSILKKYYFNMVHLFLIVVILF